MPMEKSIRKTKSGREVYCGLNRGQVTAADIEVVERDIKPGGPYENWPLLFIQDRSVEITPGARAAIKRMNNPDSTGTKLLSAVVIGSPILRMVTSLMVRLSGHEEMEIFSSEEDALDWLDKAIAERDSKAAGLTSGS